MKSSILYAAILLLATSLLFGCSDEDKVPAKTYKLGDLYQKDGVKGVVYEVSDEGRHGMIVSLDEKTAVWATEEVKSLAVGATDDRDGLKNLKAVMAISGWEQKFPAFAWCNAKNMGGVTGWVLPAYYQLRDLYRVYAVDKVKFDKFLTDNGGVAINVTSTENQDYWSSTEASDSPLFADSYEFFQGNGDFPFKTDLGRVRAVRAF